MSAASRIATKDLRLRVRDRSAFIIGIVAPLALAFIFQLVFGDTFDDTSFDLQYGVVDLDDSDISHAFGAVLIEIEADGLLAVTDFSSAADAEEAIEADEIDAFYLIESGLAEAVFNQEQFTIFVIGDIDAPTSTQIATSIAEQYGQGITTAQLSIGVAATMSSSPPTPGQMAIWAEEAASGDRSFVIEDISAATKQLDQTTYFAAGMAVFFLFFTVQFGVLGLLEEDQDGTLTRLLSAPIKATSVVLGKAYLSFLLGMISMTVLIVATHFLLGAEWGAPLGVALLVTAGVLSAIGIMALVAAVAKTPEGAGNLGSIIAVILGMLGGVFFPIGQGDDLLAKLTYLTPHAWFLTGLGDLADGAPWTEALPATGAMMLFAVVAGGIGFGMLNKRFRR